MNTEHAELIRLGLLAAWAVSIAVIFMHASYNGKNILAALALSLIPGFGFILYFVLYYVNGVGNAVRRAKVQDELHWELVLTDKGKKKNPYEKEKDGNGRLPDISKSPHIIEASPPSREIKGQNDSS